MVKVFSLGGSVIVPNEINVSFLNEFRKFILNYSKKEKIIIVCGGGGTARKYIYALNAEKVNEKIQNYIGIRITRLNAWFLINFFKEGCAKTIAKSLKEVQNLLKKNRIVILGGLRYHEETTSDGTAANLAKVFHADFINITNVPGLFDRNPKEKNARLINKISHEEFLKRARNVKYKPGQHFVLDQNAAEIIKKYHIKTYIVSSDLKNLKRLLHNKKCIGTIINGI